MNSKRNCDDKTSKALVWDESYSVRAKILGQQHRSLFDILNELRMACVQKLGKEKVLIIIQELYAFSNLHFRDEEALLDKKRYAKLDKQQTQHAIFLDYVIDLERKVKSDVALVDEEILTFIMVWWEEHILKVDMEYSKIL